MGTAQRPMSKLADAIVSNSLEELVLLLDADADAAEKKIKHAADAPPLGFACLHGRPAIVNELIARGVDLLAQDDDGRYALHCACERGHLECARAMLAALAPKRWIRPMLRSRDKNGWSPLLLAARSGILADIIAAFDEGQPDLNESHEKSGRTALMLCASRGDTEGVRALLEHPKQEDSAGCDVNFANAGMTALMYAAMDGHTEVAALLVEHGCDVDLQQQERQETAAHMACSMGHDELGKMLVEHGTCGQLSDLDGKLPLELLCSLEPEAEEPAAEEETAAAEVEEPAAEEEAAAAGVEEPAAEEGAAGVE